MDNSDFRIIYLFTDLLAPLIVGCLLYRHGKISDALISRILLAHGVHISHAKIGTYGEKVEDSFHLTDAQHRPLTDAATLAALKQALLTALQ